MRRLRCSTYGLFRDLTRTLPSLQENVYAPLRAQLGGVKCGPHCLPARCPPAPPQPRMWCTISAVCGANTADGSRLGTQEMRSDRRAQWPPNCSRILTPTVDATPSGARALRASSAHSSRTRCRRLRRSVTACSGISACQCRSSKARSRGPRGAPTDQIGVRDSARPPRSRAPRNCVPQAPRVHGQTSTRRRRAQRSVKAASAALLSPTPQRTTNVLGTRTAKPLTTSIPASSRRTAREA